VTDPVDVVVYGAPDCGLCDVAKAVLEPASTRLGFRLRAVDISQDPELEARYRESIPVVEIDGERAFVYHVLPDALERRIEAAQARRASGAS
jgi:glutaredoxin